MKILDFQKVSVLFHFIRFIKIIKSDQKGFLGFLHFGSNRHGWSTWFGIMWSTLLTVLQIMWLWTFKTTCSISKHLYLTSVPIFKLACRTCVLDSLKMPFFVSWNDKKDRSNFEDEKSEIKSRPPWTDFVHPWGRLLPSMTKLNVAVRGRIDS